MNARKNYRFRIVLPLLTVILLVTCSFGKENKENKDNIVTLHGAIEDSQCAYNVHSEGHSHDWMIKKHVEGANDARSCTQHCVHDMGGNFVLVVKNEVYRLADQDLAGKFAGENVKASGILDAKTHTLHHFTMEQEK
jgi:hypothetical protein